MPYSYLDDIATADVAFCAYGSTWEEMFSASVDATMNVLVEDLKALRFQIERKITLNAENVEMLLFKYLNEFIYFKDAEQLLLRVKDIQIVKIKNQYVLKSLVAGEKIDVNKHRFNTDVKAITLHRFKVEKKELLWEATVVVDV